MNMLLELATVKATEDFGAEMDSNARTIRWTYFGWK